MCGFVLAHDSGVPPPEERFDDLLACARVVLGASVPMAQDFGHMHD
jgi:hypothetical protein